MGLCLAPANASVLGTPMGCPSIPFNSVLTLPDIAQASSLRAPSHKTVPHVRRHPKSWIPVGPMGFEFRCPLFCSEASQVAQESACQHRRLRFDPLVRKISWKRKWPPTPVFLPGKSHGQRSRVGYSPWGHKESDTP